MLEYLTWITANIVLVSNSIFGTPHPVHAQLQVPQCLAAKMTTAHDVLAENEQFKIIDLPGSDIENVTLLAEQVNCGDFIDVTDKFSDTLLTAKRKSAENILQSSALTALKKSQEDKNIYEIKHQKEVNAAIKEVVADNIWQTLNHLTSYSNRSATKDTGVAAANWLKSEFETMAMEYNRRDTATFLVKAGWYKQPSLVTVIGKELKTPAIVIGAPMDTLDGNMPGADEGSGAAAIMESTRILLASKLKFKHPIYIIWYAASDRNLAGSQYVVQYFQEKSIPVKAVLQLNKTGFRANSDDSTMWVFTDNTNNDLNQYIAKLIKNYIHTPVNFSQCNYECSDHISWSQENIPVTYAVESDFKNLNPYIGSSSDTMDFLNLEHIANFSKLAIAFSIELGSK
ncbi:M28 family peptidase [Legionella pneumophila]|uniref:aminopeptidase LapA n=1 Tax=Legionella pneumophila TaxID=446 RepID=UPI001374C57A|nr:M28 family peptidase [Legionella pneumophila]HAT8816361.1 M28 family peptidase [Legionella pneumophila subsp. pneumophila]MCZ4804496.1 M28 family peptidase [Legionella pneumophila]MDW9180552.1 M28 family peptidase [Legionella pneumophila]HAT1824756.1 M28 family peptidase [Legionella pneumophila]HAT1865334.1 M28 family peptidase [Legionella pneumophila]